MKKLMVVVMLVLAGCTPMPVKETPPIVSVIDMPGHTKEQIYTATKIWIAENFRSAKAVIENDDKEAGRVIGNGSMKYPCSGISCMALSDWTLDFTMRVDMKDQKMKITFINLALSYPPDRYSAGANHRALRNDQVDDVRTALVKLGEELKASIGKEKAGASW